MSSHLNTLLKFPVARWLRLYLFDHAIFRIIYPNRFRVGTTLYRSGHPVPPHYARLKQLGIQRIINLRGGNPKDFYFNMEQQQCQRFGIELITIKSKATRLMSKNSLQQLCRVLQDTSVTALVHCKSGADRTGFAATLYKMLVENQTYPKANQLRLIYGHNRLTVTGVLDYFFREFQSFHQHNPHINLVDWIELYYDKHQLEQAYHRQRLDNRLLRLFKTLLFIKP